jgi:hypothetical protein
MNDEPERSEFNEFVITQLYSFHYVQQHGICVHRQRLPSYLHA